jgi:dipeptide transport system substrate-binding protein
MTSAFMIALAVLLTGTAARAEKTFVYCSEASPSTFNPQLGTDGPTFNASAEMSYNRLVDFKPGTTELIPSLASSWKISTDAKTYTFTLRKGVKFHSRGEFKPTRDFSSADVVFTVKRMLDPKHPYHRINGGSYEFFESMGLGTLIKNVEAVDPLTVRFTLARPESPFLADLGMSFTSILSVEYGEWLLKNRQPEKLDLEPIGTGPFVWKSYAKDNLIRYEAFPSYFEGRPKIDKMVFSITPDASVRYQRLKAGECHLIAEPAPQDVQSMKGIASTRMVSGPGMNVGYLGMNTKKAPLDKREVRLAIYHALNRTAYINAIYLGQAQVAKNPIPPTLWGYDKSTVDYEYSPSKAKEFLKQAGLANGFEIQLWTLPVSRPYNPNGKKMGEMMQADLGKVGIRVKLVSYDWPTYLSKTKAGEHELLQMGWTGDNGDPDNFLYTLLSCGAISGGSNLARWCNEEFDKLVEQARLEPRQSARAVLYRQAQQLFHKEAPWVPIAHSTVFRAHSPNLLGYVLNPLGTESFYQLDLK